MADLGPQQQVGPALAAGIKGQRGIPARANGPAAGIMEFAGLKWGPGVNAGGYCALPAAHPRLTRLRVTHTSSHRYSHHHITASACAICQIAPPPPLLCVEFIYYIHFIRGGAAVSALLF